MPHTPTFGGCDPLVLPVLQQGNRAAAGPAAGPAVPSASDTPLLWALKLEICCTLGGVQECSQQGAAHAPQQRACIQAQPDAGCLGSRAVYQCSTLFLCMLVQLQLLSGITAMWLCRGGTQVGLAVACMWHLVHFGHVNPLVAESHFPLLERAARCCVLCLLSPRSSCTRPH